MKTDSPIQRRNSRFLQWIPIRLLMLMSAFSVLWGVCSLLIFLPLGGLTLAGFMGQEPEAMLTGISFVTFGAIGAIALIPSVLVFALSTYRSTVDAQAIRNTYRDDLARQAHSPK